MTSSFSNLFENLKCNDKDVIKSLTKYAKTNCDDAENIVNIIFKDRRDGILRLYLIDSIIKNAREPYVHIITREIVEIFEGIFIISNVEIRKKMFALRHTWRGIFSNEKLLELDKAINRLDVAWPLHVSTLFYCSFFFDNIVKQKHKPHTKLNANRMFVERTK